MDRTSEYVNPDLSLFDVTELKPENYIDLWRSVTNAQYHFGEEQINIVSMLSHIFVGQEMFDLFEKCVQELDQEKLTKLKENEQFLRAFIQLKLHKKAFKDIFILIRDAEFKNPEGLVDIWDEAHYREKEETLRQPLTALERFRIRKKNPPPVNICPSGRQLKTITDQARATLKRWYEKHISDPYPSKLKKQKLADKSGLTLNQVKTWFSNARRNRRKKRLSKKTDTNPKQLPKSKSESTGRLKADSSSSITEWKVYELLVDKIDMDNAAVIANHSELMSVDSEPVKLEVFDCSSMCIQKSAEVHIAGENSQETVCTASDPDTTSQIKEYERTAAEEVKDHIDQIACGLFVLKDSEEDNTSSDNVDQSSIPESKSMVTETKNSLVSNKSPQEIKISNSTNIPGEQHMYMNNHFEISLTNDLQKWSTDAHRAEQMTERVDNENYLATKPVDYKKFDKQIEIEQTTEYSKKEIKPESNRQGSIRADNEQSNKPERYGFQLERKRCTSTEPYNQTCIKMYPDSSDPDSSPISVIKGAVGLRNEPDENFTEFHKEMNAATPEDIKIHNKKPQVSINTGIQTLLKRKLIQKNLPQIHHSCSQQNGEDNEIIPHGENVTVQGRDSVDMSYNSFGSLKALSELCNSIDQDDFSHCNVSQPSVPYGSKTKHQSSKKSEKLRTAWIESLASSKAMNCPLEGVETRHSLCKNYKPFQLNVGLNQDAESFSKQRYPPISLHQAAEDSYIPAGEHPYYSSTSQRNCLKLLSPRIADDAETDRHATDFYTPSDYRQTTFQGRNQSLSCGQSGIEQNIPYTSGLWQCRPPHPDLVDVPPYKAQPFMSGCHGNNFSGHSYCCDIPQNIQQASIISGSQHGHISMRTNSEYDYSQDTVTQYHWSSQDSVSKNSVDDAVQGLLNLSSQESDF